MRLLIAVLVAACVSACALGERTAFNAPGTASTGHGLYDPYWRTHTGWRAPVMAPLNHVAPDSVYGYQSTAFAPAPAWTRPDPDKTPGVTTGLSQAEVCGKKWGRDERHVTDAMKASVFRAYGLAGNADPRCLPDAHGKRCEIDHLVSRELGGADDVRNLWPEPYGGPWNAHDKDRIENRLHVEVCTLRTLTLDQAQALIRTDWQAAYRSRFGEPA